MSAERQNPGGRGRVLPWRPRHPPAGNDNRRPDPASARGAVGDLSPFERVPEGDQAERQDDYRHRMMVNALAFVVCIFLVLLGVWLASQLAQMRKDQDCVLSGRRGCTPVDVPVRSRW